MTVEVLTPDRVCFGSDFPLESHSVETMREVLAGVAGLDISPEDRRAVLGGNARRLLARSAADGR